MPGDDVIEAVKAEVLKPLKTYVDGKDFTVTDDITPNYILPKAFLFRLNKIMDEYAGGTSMWYSTNKPMLEQGKVLLQMLKEDAQLLGARNLHELMRCWENFHRLLTSIIHVEHLLFREETRYPGYYYRADFPDLDQANWNCFTISKYDVNTGEITMRKEPMQSPVLGE
jgi:adenylylsulfate reductase subunit A